MLSIVRSVRVVRRVPMMTHSLNQRCLHTHFSAAEREEQDDMVLNDHSDLFTSKTKFIKFVSQANNQSVKQSNAQNDQVKADDYDGNDTTQSVMEAAGLHTHRLVDAEMVHHH